MGVWTMLAIIAGATGVLALLVPHAQRFDAPWIRRLGYRAVDDAPASREDAARRASARVVTPLAVLSLLVTIGGLIATGSGRASGVTTLVGLLLAGAAMLAGHLAVERAVRRG
jgi:hypothetical protein